jgi:general secretion pathway protein B
MSYILDALRKSDQQRQRGAAPTLLTAQATAAEPGQPAYFIYGLLAAVLVGAGIVIGWLQRTQGEPTGPAAVTIAAKPLESSARQTAPAPVTPARPALSLSNTGTPGTPPKAVTAATKDALTPVPENPAGPTDSMQEPKVMTIGELPASIRQELPGMQISLHLHSTKPGNSFVSINSQMLQEGAYPAPGLKLEQITPDGMIFSYKGYRFRRGVQ